MTFLTAYFDPKLKIDPKDTPARIEAAERKRLSRDLAVIRAASEFPRRLGQDATFQDLAADKRRCRRIIHAMNQPLRAWGGETNSYSGDIKSEAAQLDWQTWSKARKRYLEKRMRYIATLGHLQPQHFSWAKRAVLRLHNELQWTEYALR